MPTGTLEPDSLRHGGITELRTGECLYNQQFTMKVCNEYTGQLIRWRDWNQSVDKWIISSAVAPSGKGGTLVLRPDGNMDYNSCLSTSGTSKNTQEFCKFYYPETAPLEAGYQSYENCVANAGYNLTYCNGNYLSLEENQREAARQGWQ